MRNSIFGTNMKQGIDNRQLHETTAALRAQRGCVRPCADAQGAFASVELVTQ
jgi:hypothetical protein